MMTNPRISFALLILSCTAAPAYAQSADEAIKLVKTAKTHLKKQGIERACKDFADPAAGFQKDELYVSVMDLRQAGKITMVCNPKNARINGKDLVDMKDMDGKFISREMAEVARVKGHGWVNYRWLNPVSGNMENKSSYVESQEEFIVVAGIYKK